MKKIFLISCTLFNFILFPLCAQEKKDSIIITQNDLIGVWQINSPTVGSGLDTYIQFYKSKRFIYNTSGYNDLNPLLNICGHYKLEGNLLWLKVDSSKQLIGAKIIEESPGFQSGLFVLTGGKVVTFSQKGTGYEFHNLSVCSNSKTKQIKCIIIDNDKYYKLSNNPDASF